MALAESGCNPSAHSSTGDYGFWQVHQVDHRQWTAQQLYDPQTNANAAWSISGSGSSWQPWTNYRSGAYQAQVNAASTAIGQP